jgi:hypothetical protein
MGAPLLVVLNNKHRRLLYAALYGSLRSSGALFQSCYKTLTRRAAPCIDLINDNHYHLFENISMHFD